MLIAGQILTQDEAHELEFISKTFFIAYRMKQIVIDDKNGCK